MDPSFLCDSMLGDIARWLRLLGYDAAYAPRELDDDAVLDKAEREGRILATRDQVLAQRASRRHLPHARLSGTDRLADLEELLRAADASPDPDRFFSRCTHCNEELRTAPRERVKARVPAAVFDQHSAFRECPGCGQVYWEGSHVVEIGRELATLLARLRRPRAERP